MPPIPPCSFPSACDIPLGAWAIGQAVSLAALYYGVTVHILTFDRSPCLSRLNFRPFHPQPPHYHFVMIDFARYFIVMTCRVYPSGRPRGSRDLPVARSRVRHLLAGSPTGLAESGSLALRTGHSPQIAPHLSSRKRNYHCWIQAGNVSLDGTYTHLIKRLHRRTRHAAPRDDNPRLPRFRSRSVSPPQLNSAASADTQAPWFPRPEP